MIVVGLGGVQDYSRIEVSILVEVKEGVLIQRLCENVDGKLGTETLSSTVAVIHLVLGGGAPKDRVVGVSCGWRIAISI